ncbi:TauD/TfdA family dioxygenase [Bacillus safensis]|uniref:TauD/TfdA family dioxygenase n=1 Tax=Bacillus safensis TaxID=561879 RepID=UPI000DAE862F|nr:TauD/TfdA family dioxygenase [Bacillus safensis]
MKGNTIKNATFFEKNLVDVKDIHAVTKQINKNGIVTFENINSKNELLNISKNLGEVYFHRDSDVDGVTHVINKEGLDDMVGFKGLTSAELNLHTDRSGVEKPPELLLFYCKVPARQGGETLLVNGKDIYYKLKKDYPGILNLISKENSVVYGGGNNNFNTSIFQFTDEGRIQIRFRYDELGYYSSSIISIMPLFHELLDSYCISFQLKKHQGYIIKNDQWLHGRTTFSGKREMYRILLSLNRKVNDCIKKGFIV